MTASVYNFTLEQGTTLDIPIQWLSDNVPTNITGYTVRCQIRATAFSTTVIDELTTENGRITTVPLDGKFTLHFTPETTSGYLFQTAVYDIELVNPSTSVTRLLQGTITLSPEVTK